MPRHRSRVHAVRALVALGIASAALTIAVPVGAQTTTTTAAPTTTTTAAATTTTRPATPTTTPATTAPVGTTAPATPVTEAPLIATKDDSGSDIPWVPIAIGVIVLVVIGVLLALLARKRGARKQVMLDWRERAASTTAEAGTTARLLSTGTPVSRQIAQQVLTTLRDFEDLTQAAPDDETRAAADRGRRAVQALGLAIDADYQLNRAQPPATQGQLDASSEALRNAATDTDRALRRVYRGFTEPD